MAIAVGKKNLTKEEIRKEKRRKRGDLKR